ncbi:hypothetical protein [Bifidobacterium sp.]|uniref:hypothetical protein n=1 Tax=Bifidobacterium sp. TaxID=41200 RepID=UPI0039EC3DC3
MRPPPRMKMMPSPASQQGAILHQLTRIADNLTPDTTFEVTREKARESWERTGMRIYEDQYLQALANLGIQIV